MGNCLGKNFAQMEMRLILAFLLKDFDFSLAGATAREVGPNTRLGSSGVKLEEFGGINRGTMGPMNLENREEKVWGTRYLVGRRCMPRRGRRSWNPRPRPRLRPRPPSVPCWRRAALKALRWSARVCGAGQAEVKTRDLR